MTTNEHTERAELIRKAMRRAFSLGQTYCEQAESEYQSQWNKADGTKKTFEGLLKETVALLEAQRPELKPLTDERWFQSELFKLAVQKGLLSVHTEHLAGGWSKDVTKVSWMEGHNKACDISNEAAHGIKEQQL